MKIGLSSDSSCTLYGDNATNNNISIFPLNVIVNGEEFLDGVNIDHKQFLSDMRSGKNIKTSTPPPQDVINYFTKLFEKENYDYIIHFTISSKLSSMFSLFTMISEEYFNNKVIVIDSYSVCSLMCSHIFYAKECIEQGKSIETIKEELEKRKNNDSIIFIPENLTALKNGGRISPAIAAIGNLIGLKPVLKLEDGGLVKDSTTRNVKKTICELIPKLIEKFPIDKYDYCIHTFDGDPKLIEFVNNQLKQNGIDTHNKTFDIALNVCAHCGPGTIGLLISQKIGNRSYYEFIK